MPSPQDLEDAARSARWAHQEADLKAAEAWRTYSTLRKEEERLRKLSDEADRSAEVAWLAAEAIGGGK